MRENLIGQTFHRLKVVSYAGADASRHSLWNCRCICGEKTVARGRNLKSGVHASCGCLQREWAYANTRHGHARRLGGDTTYESWENMIQRCANPKARYFKYYGGAGVRVCKRWLTSFKNFYLDMGKRPQGTTLGRFKDTGDYKPCNCAWMTRAQQRAEARKKRGRC